MSFFFFLFPAAILYELLYDGVFKVDQSVLAQCQRAARNDALSDDNLPLCGSSDESDTDAGETLWWESRLALQFLESFLKTKAHLFS